MSNLDLIEKILIGNGYRQVYSSFDAFWDNQIANSYFVVSGPAKPFDDSDEAVATRREAARAYLEPKYWA